MKIGSGIVIGKDDAAGASAVRKPPEDRRRKSDNPNPNFNLERLAQINETILITSYTEHDRHITNGKRIEKYQENKTIRSGLGIYLEYFP
jgi:hypothetical protein